MKTDYYNNIGIGIVAISSVLNHVEELPASKAFLIVPFITHLGLTKFLASKKTNTKSIEELITQKTSCFSNFNKRYYGSLLLTMNAIQYLIDMEYIKITEGKFKKLKSLEFDIKMGGRADKIYKASANIAKILKGSENNLYLNLRIEL